MIKLNIDFDKIDQSRLVQGRKGRYLDLVLIDHPTDYGDGFIKQDCTKEERQAGLELPIIGNWKEVQTGQRNQQQQPRRQEPQRSAPPPPRKPAPPKDPDLDPDDDSDIPF